MLTTQTASEMVAVECVYDLADGRRLRRVLLMSQPSDPLYGAAVVALRAEKAAAAQVAGRAIGPIYTRVLAAVPVESLTPEASAPELAIDGSPSFGQPSPYREHRI